MLDDAAPRAPDAPPAPRPTDGPDAAPVALRLRLLGAFRVEVGDRAVAADVWRLHKAAALVKLLALAPGHRLHREQVQEWLWPDLAPEAAYNNLRYALHVARRTLVAPGAPGAHALALRRDIVSLGPDGGLWTDVTAFEAAAAAARRAQEPAAYRAALDLYAGDLLPDDPYEDWAAGRREELRALQLALLGELARACEARGEPAAAIAALERLAAREPTDEAAHRELMRLHALAGRRGRALRQYALLAATLERELAVAPETATTELHAAILAGRMGPAPAAALTAAPASPGLGLSAPTSAAPPAGNLTASLSSFVGRERELAELAGLLPTTRLLTLTGVGGVGKTRLALQVAADRLADHPDGAWFVELAALTDPALAPGAVAAALRVTEQPGRPITETVADWLAERRLLLVLDNCEHLLDACARLAEALLRAAPGLRLLATSRERLNAAGETAWRVPSLAVPPDDGTVPEVLERVASVRLFVARAREVAPGFAVTRQNAVAVAGICRRLDGIPLALELAAAWAATLSTGQIAARLEDGLPLLTDGRRTAPARQRTLRATLDWSHGLLAAGERALLRRLAVFAGGWTLAAAEATCAGAGVTPGEVVRLLARLVDQSLVQVEGDADDAAGEGRRYRLLATVRQYAAERLEEAGEVVAVRERHAAHFLALAERAEPALASPEQLGWLSRLDAEHDNLRAVLAWCAERDPQAGLRLVGSLAPFWQLRGHYIEGSRWLDGALARAPERAAWRVKALLGAAGLAWWRATGPSSAACSTRAWPWAGRWGTGAPSPGRCTRWASCCSRRTITSRPGRGWRRGWLSAGRLMTGGAWARTCPSWAGWP